MDKLTNLDTHSTIITFRWPLSIFNAGKFLQALAQVFKLRIVLLLLISAAGGAMIAAGGWLGGRALLLLMVTGG